MEPDSRAFARNAQRALSDKALQAALANAIGRSAARRAAAVAAFPGFEAARERASGIRRETLAHLDAHLARFIDEAEKRGAVVHVARDAAQARGIAVRNREGPRGSPWPSGRSPRPRRRSPSTTPCGKRGSRWRKRTWEVTSPASPGSRRPTSCPPPST